MAVQKVKGRVASVRGNGFTLDNKMDFTYSGKVAAMSDVEVTFNPADAGASTRVVNNKADSSKKRINEAISVKKI